MKKKAFAVLVVASLVFLLFLWAPWITNEYAVNLVVEKLGGPEARFNYLGEDIAVKDVPRQVGWFPFGKYVEFPGEAGWNVNFYGGIS